MRWPVLVMCFGLWAMLGAKAADQKTDLRSQSTDELIQGYQRAGLALQGTLDVPTDQPISRLRPPPPNAMEEEIVRRGSEIVPQLLRFLETEAVTHRPADKNGIIPSFTGDVLGMLVKIGDPRAVPVVLRILEGLNGQAGAWGRRAALCAIEELTYCAMRKVAPFHSRHSGVVEHPNAIADESFENPDAAARMYREWLAGEGKDPSEWLSLARKRARRLLNDDDPDAAYCAAVFLWNPVHDDDPQATIKRVAEIVDELRPGATPDTTSYRGRRSAVHIRNWTHLLASFGPRAEPYARTLIRIKKERSLNEWGGYEELGKVGGVEIMDYLIEVLPRIGAAVAELRVHPTTSIGRGSDDPHLWWRESLRCVQGAIDRWAGRTFADDGERITWWKANRDRAREAWLTENLEALVEQADAGVSRAAWLAGEILPDLPKPLSDHDHDAVPDPNTARIENRSGPFRAEWLRENRAKLKYDPQAGVFRLPAGGAPQ